MQINSHMSTGVDFKVVSYPYKFYKFLTCSITASGKPFKVTCIWSLVFLGKAYIVSQCTTAMIVLPRWWTVKTIRYMGYFKSSHLVTQWSSVLRLLIERFACVVLVILSNECETSIPSWACHLPSQELPKHVWMLWSGHLTRWYFVMFRVDASQHCRWEQSRLWS